MLGTRAPDPKYFSSFFAMLPALPLHSGPKWELIQQKLKHLFLCFHHYFNSKNNNKYDLNTLRFIYTGFWGDYDRKNSIDFSLVLTMTS